MSWVGWGGGALILCSGMGGVRDCFLPGGLSGVWRRLGLVGIWEYESQYRYSEHVDVVPAGGVFGPGR